MRDTYLYLGTSLSSTHTHTYNIYIYKKEDAYAKSRKTSEQ